MSLADLYEAENTRLRAVLERMRETNAGMDLRPVPARETLRTQAKNTN